MNYLATPPAPAPPPLLPEWMSKIEFLVGKGRGEARGRVPPYPKSTSAVCKFKGVLDIHDAPMHPVCLCICKLCILPRSTVISPFCVCVRIVRNVLRFRLSLKVVVSRKRGRGKEKEEGLRNMEVNVDDHINEDGFIV